VAFGITKKELITWKQQVKAGEIAFITHYWLDERFPDCTTVTKVGCSDLDKLLTWGKKYQLSAEWIDYKNNRFPHFDLFGERQKYILEKENQWEQLKRFDLLEKKIHKKS
jgi:hypothetical protein